MSIEEEIGYRLRWSQRLRDAIASVAKDENRSINAEITTALEFWLKMQKAKAARPEVTLESLYERIQRLEAAVGLI